MAKLYHSFKRVETVIPSPIGRKKNMHEMTEDPEKISLTHTHTHTHTQKQEIYTSANWKLPVI